MLALLLIPAQLAGLAPEMLPGTKASADAPPSFLDLRRPLPNLDADDALLVDLTGDEAPELVLLWEDEPVAVLFNDGNAVFTFREQEASFPGGAPVAETALAADFDADGNQDVVFDDALYFGRGNGVFDAPVSLAFLGAQRPLLTFDMDGDGDEDLLAEGAASLLLRNDGSGGFSLAGSFPFGGSGIGATAGDFDGDGDVDLEITGRLFENDGSGSFEEQGSLFGGFFPSSPMTPADADGDGDLDFVVTGITNSVLAGGLYVFENSGGPLASAFGQRSRVSSLQPRTFGVVDLNGDGAVDVLSLQPQLVLLNDGSGSFLPDDSGLPPAVNGTTGVLRVEDLDRDGDADVLSIDARFEIARLLLGDDTGAFYETQRFVVPEVFEPMLSTDLDGDGDLDLVGFTSRVEVRYNDGTGVFSDPGELLQPPISVFSRLPVAAGDLDGDGAQDLVFGGLRAAIYMQRDGVFVDETASRVSTFTFLVQAIAVADFDQDGDEDLYLGTGAFFDASPDVLEVNDGQGVFTSSSAPLGADAVTISLAVADFDGDGALDVFAGNRGPNTLLLGAGDGSFADASAGLPTAASSQRTEDLAVADFDGDGDLDVYEANSQSISLGASFQQASDRLLWNDGAGGFTASAQHVTDDRALAAEAFDADGDGDVDVVVGRGFSSPIPSDRRTIAYANDGDGVLTPMAFPESYDDVALSAEDVDGDGDVDVVGTRAVFTNVSRQTSLSGHARVDRPFGIQVFGDPSSNVILVASLGRASIQTDVGLLLLDPLDLVFTGTGTVGPAGAYRAAFAGLALPVGTTVHWQALVGATPRLTNLETTTFVAF